MVLVVKERRGDLSHGKFLRRFCIHVMESWTHSIQRLC